MTDNSDSLGFDHVVLVDENDNPLGVADKLRAHTGGGSLHRAFSVFILNEHQEILLQRRAHSKYHCGGLWSNSCCSHPRHGRDVVTDARTRLSVELGFSTGLELIGTALYKEEVNEHLTEWELDYLYVGTYLDEIHPNPAEVDAIRWCNLRELKKGLDENPTAYTPWLPHILPVFTDWQSGE